MATKCPEKDCWAPELACNLGSDLTQCPHYKELVKEGNGSKGATTDFLLPWSGNSLGTVDLQFIAGRSRPIVIGVIGAHGAGKTTLLTALYLLLCKGDQVFDRRFAGSYTLGGWENLAHSLRWTSSNHGPHFPPHTPNDAGRLPGLLHMAFRRGDGNLEDVLFTDAPGEWFERWAVDKDAPDIEGARWISRNTDSFVLLVDCDALSGPNRGEARTNINLLSQRLSSELRNRPIAVVWSKSDKDLNKTIKEALFSNFSKLFQDHKEFAVSVQRKENESKVTEEAFIKLLSWLIESRRPSSWTDLELPVTQTQDAFLAFRG
jgi:hypothetical protein